MNYINLITLSLIYIGIPFFILYKLRNWGLLDLADRIGKVFDALVRYVFYCLVIFLLITPSIAKENLFNFLELFNYIPEAYKLIFTVKAPLNEVQIMPTPVPQTEELKEFLSASIDQYSKLNNKLDDVVLELQKIQDLEKASINLSIESHNLLIDKIANTSQTIKDSILSSSDAYLKVFNGQTKEILLSLSTIDTSAQKAIFISNASYELLTNISTNGKELATLIQAQSDLYMDGVESLLKSNNANSSILQELQLGQEKTNQRVLEVRNSYIESSRIQQRQTELGLENLSKKVDEFTKPKAEEKSGVFSLPKISDYIFKK